MRVFSDPVRGDTATRAVSPPTLAADSAAIDPNPSLTNQHRSVDLLMCPKVIVAELSLALGRPRGGESREKWAGSAPPRPAPHLGEPDFDLAGHPKPVRYHWVQPLGPAAAPLRAMGQTHAQEEDKLHPVDGFRVESPLPSPLPSLDVWKECDAESTHTGIPALKSCPPSAHSLTCTLDICAAPVTRIRDYCAAYRSHLCSISV
ncbi:hypothetical protein A1Q1_02624 [Trichosporon asahii var. asahii CBS 2479]|uniref:Uncharacterized protein n=1 Tax=Trichosporon asahii var. asahii (strain ATCC 90039 / CBS 2479 / JCM 2466 / KCTC 7840 / NBRC 103889/ NCYC 2677 / UAMH 7654) TaxID=1186058 RepID=J5SZC6_TRIAS|nr:hypothetical protein A1Q1_02624 [Trichosporon asahii var. asahii CBS 2479]EJT48341.1 hypothetical protein A1Q1_02624 [Trichosporon asahii var. asahii CBS 2479]